MDKDSLPSLSDILPNSINICSKTIISRDGKVQSYCGLTLTNIYTEGLGRPPLPNNINRGQKHKAVASTSMHPFNASQLSGTVASTSAHPFNTSELSSAGVPISYHNLGPPSYVCRRCNAQMWYEERKNKGNKAVNLTFSLCCQKGKVLLLKFNDTPTPLDKLLNFNDPRTSKFRDQIRVYNGMFCFTSFGARIDHSINTGRGLYTFRINGQNYHRIGSLLPAPGFQPRYAQLYFFDTDNEVRNRMSAFLDTETGQGVDQTIVAGLMDMLDQKNAVAQSFRMARDWCHSYESVNFELRLLSDRTSARQYNAPTVSEVAALITNDFGDGIPSRDIVVDNKDEGPKRISELHPSYIALQYPLLFPYGEDGYHDKIPYHTNRGTRKTKRGFVSMKEYYAYIIQQRNDQGNTLLKGGRLYQQFLVDAFTAVEEQRLKWTRNNQDSLRVDLYHNLNDAFTRGDTNAEGLGKRIVLPRTFTGGPRYMMQNYQDAKALCRAYRNLDLFITFTSNPKWPEIAEMLSFIPGQKPYKRPKVGTRVFKMKPTQLLDDLTKYEIFRKSCAVVYVIEFQKQGLPHAHILLWLEEEWKCQTPSQVDNIISVEMPSPTNDPKGYKVVTEFMLHDPCGKGAACTVDDKCSKKYPKPFYPETNFDEDGYPVYRRRDSKIQAVKGKFTYDNKYVVPYNRYLLIKYQAHINVEWCNRSKAIKYLFKYLNKGPDRATFVIQENVQNGPLGELQKVASVDEIKNYLNCRYLAPCEAVWRLFSFEIHYSYPSVMKLNFHLEDQHTITLRDSENLPALLNREDIKITMFTEWPLRLCEETWELLSQDILLKKQLLNKNGRSLADFQELPRPNPALLTKLDNRLIREAMDFDIKQSKLKHDQLHSLLNLEQRAIYEDVIQSVHNGTGKTFVYKTIISRIRSEGIIVLAVASSGIALLLLPGGRTAPSRFVIPLELVENSTRGIK
ncbi:helicase [Tanacetum coccineum]